MPNKIIGLAGTNGSGKDTVGQFLADEHGYCFVSVTTLLRDELKQREITVDREHLRALSAEWRREFGYSVLVDRALASFEEADKSRYVGLVLASLRNPYEADRVHELGGTVAWIDADPQVRYRRVQANAAGRGRSAEDNKTYEQFLAEEAAEMHQPAGGDAANLDMAAVKASVDLTLLNDGDNLEQLKRSVETALGL